MNPMLGKLREANLLSDLDLHFAKTLEELTPQVDPRALLGAALCCRHTQQGHVCLSVRRFAGKPILSPEGVLVDGLSYPEAGEWLGVLRDCPFVELDPRDRPGRPLVLDAQGRLYLSRYYLYQHRLANEIRDRLHAPAPRIDEDLLRQGLALLFPIGAALAALSRDQERAVEQAIRQTLFILSGGPGTGKTSTVVKVLILYLSQALSVGRLLPRILLLAPTGKAALRLEEAVHSAILGSPLQGLPHENLIREAIQQLRSSTIHRALGLTPDRPTRPAFQKGRPLPADVVIVDEASMVDLALLTKLFEAVHPEARILLLGDKDQLASVEAGAILGDLCRGADPEQERADEGETAVRLRGAIGTLTHSFRFHGKSGIGLLARAIHGGDAALAFEILRDSATRDVQWIELQDPGELPRVLRSVIQEDYAPYLRARSPGEKLEALNAFRILCALRKGAAGVERMNLLAEEALGLGAFRNQRNRWYEGLPILIIVNDYQLQCWNGDVGVVSLDPTATPPVLRAYFPGKKLGISPARLPAHETVFAMTIHKSQGSELDRVLCILPENPTPIVTRELLYTAVTRAKKSLVVCASRDVLAAAIKTPLDRDSGLLDRLRDGAEFPVALSKIS